MSELFAVVMAGGRGERFWPLSTDPKPKPFVPLLGSATLIQQTVARLSPLVPPERTLISIGEKHLPVAVEQLPQIPRENFIVEPVGRDTAACLGFCALHIEARDPDGIMLGLPADQYVASPDSYRHALREGMEALSEGVAVVFGISPDRPETGYGYVQAQPEDGARSWHVLRFVEKPDARKAVEYLRSGDYFWNSGIFLWRNATLLELLRRHMPALYSGLELLRPILGRNDKAAEVRRIFSSLERISVDFGVLEKASDLRLVPARFGWDDIGSWAALDRALPHDPSGNVALGPHAAVDSEGCIVYSDADTVALFGVSDLVVVQAHGKVLVCPKEQAANLKRLVAALGPG